MPVASCQNYENLSPFSGISRDSPGLPKISGGGWGWCVLINPWETFGTVMAECYSVKTSGCLAVIGLCLFKPRRDPGKIHEIHGNTRGMDQQRLRHTWVCV